MDIQEYIDNVKQSMNITKEMIGLLEKRIELATKEIPNKSEYESNELKILIHKTTSEIITLKKVFFEKKNYFEKYEIEFEKDFENAKEKFSWLLKRAQSNKGKNPKIDEFLSTIDMKIIEENPQAKVYAYKRIKKILEKTGY